MRLDPRLWTGPADHARTPAEICTQCFREEMCTQCLGRNVHTNVSEMCTQSPPPLKMTENSLKLLSRNEREFSCDLY